MHGSGHGSGLGAPGSPEGEGPVADVASPVAARREATHAAHGVLDFLSGGGEAGALVRATDWSRTPLGPPARWPQSLKTSVSICLDSGFPVLLWWGPELVMIYNDAYRPILGDKHPRSMGQPGRECWPEIWGTIGPMLEAVLERAQTSYFDDLMLPLRRRGFAEECYFTFTYSPIRDETGGVGGVFCAVTETTQRVIGERQLALLRELAARAAGARTFEGTCAATAECLAHDPGDLPFSLLYLHDPERRRLRLAGASRVARRQPDVPEELSLGDAPCAWGLAEVLAAGTARVTDVPPTLALSPPAAGAAPQRALVVPLAASPAGGRPGLLVAGLSAQRPFDDGYRRFVDLVASQIAASLANARAYDDERRRADALAELDRAKTTFFSDVSHEFRTPLTLMLGPTEEALRTGLFPPDEVALLHRNELRLLKLVNTLLDFARIEAARVQVSFEPTDLAAATADLASTFRSAFERAGLRLVVECPPLPAPVLVDRAMWEKIVLNLLSNAFKYTFEGEVSIALRWDGDHVELAVRDTGCGIPAAELPRIFDRFHRVPAARARSVEGSGIGLALVRELARLHGGGAAAESEPGKGTTIRVRLPTGDAHLPAGRIAAAPPRPAGAVVARPYVEEALRWLPGGEAAAAVAREPLAAPGGADVPAPASRARVLVVDDNADMRQYLSTLLRQRWEVEAVPDGAAAEEAVRRRRPDLVLSDVMMPGVDGFTLLRRLRSDPATREIPFILLSARAGEEARVEGVQAGADDYVVKPFAARELLARVATHLDLARARREADEGRRAAEATLRGLFEATAALMTLVELRGDDFVYLMPNARTATFFGRPPGEVDGRSGRELGLPEDIVAEWTARFRRCHADQRPLTVEYSVPRDGREHWFQATMSPVPSGPSGAPRFALVAVDVTDRKQAEVALRTADQRKTDFLAVLSHELRNPLAPIRNGLHVLERAPPGGPEALRAREVIRRQVDHVAKLVDDLLDISRINHGKIELERRIVDLRAVTRRASEDARATLEQRRVAFHLDLGDDPLWVDADETRLAQIVGNLLSNAAKFTPAGGSVEVSLRRADARGCELRVRDDGVGIDPHLLEEVFEPFAQADRTRGTARGGMGVGLALVRSLVTLHGGTVRASSEGAGRGTEVVVSLPLTQGAALEEDVPARAAVPSLSILVVEDNVDAGETLADLLRLLEHDVRLATDGRAGLEAFAASPPDVVLCDVGLPDVTGYELIRQLRALEAGRHTLAIALTGYAQPADVERALAAGFDAHLPKPPPLDELERLLAGAPRSRRPAAAAARSPAEGARETDAP